MNPIDFQDMTGVWVEKCFGPEAAADVPERNWRFIEEAIELVQSLGMTRNEVFDLVDYVYSRPSGDPAQEVGGTMVTLAALCQTNGLDMLECGILELDRCNKNIEKIREKHRNKPKNSPRPE